MAKQIKEPLTKTETRVFIAFQMQKNQLQQEMMEIVEAEKEQVNWLVSKRNLPKGKEYLVGQDTPGGDLFLIEKQEEEAPDKG